MRFVHRAVLIGTITVMPSVVSGQVTHRLIALSGEHAAGTNEIFLRFSNPVINASGDVAFQANLSGPTTDVVPHGVWVSSRESLHPLAISGQEAPGTGGARFQTPGWPIIVASDGQALFYAHLIHEMGVTSDNDYGIWAGSPEDVHVVARKPEQAPGLPTGVNYSLFFADPHSSGQMGFSASLQGPSVNMSNESAAWIGTIGEAGSLQLIARGGDPAPDLPAGSRFVSLGTPAVNAAGHVALLATATGAEPGAQKPGIWAGAADNLHAVAMAGGPAPGATGRVFDFFAGPRLNNEGHVAFMGFLQSDTDEQRLSDVGVWAGDATAADIRPIAVEGLQAPGFDPGVVFRGSAPGDAVTYDAFGNLVLGGSGHVAFVATAFGDDIDFDHNDGVWVSDPVNTSAPSLALIGREGDHPPGTPEGTRFIGIFSGDDLIPAFERPSINSTGQIAFEALTSGPLGEFGRGIWATDPSGTLQLIAHTGTNIQVAPGDVREIELLKLNAGGSSEEGYLSAFNDAGQLAFAVSFTDGSEGVFVSNAVAQLPGDFNNDGRVDAADYVLWRKDDGTQTGYDKWLANFGQTLSVGSSSAIRSNEPQSVAVPEPTTFALLLIWAAAIACLRRHRNS